MPAAVASKEPGDKIEVVFYRGDERKTVEIELGTRPSSSSDLSQEQLFPDGR